MLSPPIRDAFTAPAKGPRLKVPLYSSSILTVHATVDDVGVLTRATDALRELEQELAQYPLYAGGADALHIADRIREVRQMLSGEGARWIGTTQAKRLLGVGSENTVKAWAKMGLLRGRIQPNGRIQVLLDDVLKEREAREEITAIGGEDLTEQELEELHRSQPGTLPWEREQAAAAQ